MSEFVNMMELHFVPHVCPELALQKLKALKQGKQEVNVFLTDFQNLVMESQISDGFAKHILLNNVNALLLKKTVLKYEEPASFLALANGLQEISRA